jgi:hypothetical protein
MSNKPESIMIDEVKYIRADSAPSLVLPTGEFAPYVIGAEYFIQTVTHFYLGKLVHVGDKELAITGASWVADTGRLHQFMAGSKPKENEPFNATDLVIIGRGAVVSAVQRKALLEVL